jgi:predicted ATP-dependent endonuclease of OLD family
MSLVSVRIKNILSFDDVLINDIKDVNCIIGRNNVGKSNLLKSLRYFYAKLNDEKVLPLNLHSSYTPSGEITLTFDTTRIRKIATSRKNNGRFHKHIYNTLFRPSEISKSFADLKLSRKVNEKTFFSISLVINSDDSIRWSVSDSKVRELISTLFPFFYIETRHIDLYDWSTVWKLISNLNSFNFEGVKQDELMDYLDARISNENRLGDYKKYIEKISSIIDTKPYSYKDKVINYIKIVLSGDSFTNYGEELGTQSDGTNSHRFLEIILNLLITLTRAEFICPIVYIDEPEIGLHPKLAEGFVTKLHATYSKYKKTTTEKEQGKYATPYPKVFFNTHSSNVLKHAVKLFLADQQVLHVSKKEASTKIIKVNSTYTDARFLNLFSESEARLFFSEFIIFVEGATELEVFNNQLLLSFYPSFERADIYAANEILLNNIKPSYSKLAIPYLIVKDLDTVLDYTIASNNLKFRSFFGDFSNHLKKKINYHSSLSRQYVEDLRVFQDVEIHDVYNKDDGLFFNNFNLSNLHSRINRISALKSHFFMRTTVEGALINNRSYDLFLLWIKHLILNEMFIANDNPEEVIKSSLKSYKLKTHSADIFNALFTTSPNDYVISSKLIRKLGKIKAIYIAHLERDFNSNFPDKKTKLLAIRLVFGGKTETVKTLGKLLKEKRAAAFRAKIKSFKGKEVKFLENKLSKTSGWVTSFINFSINEIIETDDSHEDIRKKIDTLFPEITYIINLASSSIEAGEVG